MSMTTNESVVDEVGYVPPEKVVHIWLAGALAEDGPLCGERNVESHVCPSTGEIVVLPYLARYCFCHLPVCSFCLFAWEGLVHGQG